MRHVMSRYQEYQRAQACRLYITDALKAIAENTSNFAGGCKMQIRFADLLDGKAHDERTAQEIADDVIKRAGLKVTKE